MHRRQDSKLKYQLKIWAKKDETNVKVHNVESFGQDSYNMREHIWNHLQIKGNLDEVYFTERNLAPLTQQQQSIQTIRDKVLIRG